MAAKKVVNPARRFLLSRGWRKTVSTDLRRTQFMAGLARLLSAGCNIKARHNALLAYTSSLSVVTRRKLIKQMASYGGWEWDAYEDVFISYYPS